MSYWTKLINGRMNRRSALQTTGAAALGAAFLAACGGSDSGSGGDGKPADKSGLLAKAADTTKQAKTGGTWKTSYARDATSFDPAFQGTGANVLARTNNTLVSFEMGVLADARPTSFRSRAVLGVLGQLQLTSLRRDEVAQQGAGQWTLRRRRRFSRSSAPWLRRRTAATLHLG